MRRLKRTLSQLTFKRKGGVKASRNNPKSYSKQNQKEIQSDKKTSFLRKHLSLETAYTSLGMSENLQNLLKIGTSGEVSIVKVTAIPLTLSRFTPPF